MPNHPQNITDMKCSSPLFISSICCCYNKACHAVGTRRSCLWALRHWSRPILRRKCKYYPPIKRGTEKWHTSCTITHLENSEAKIQSCGRAHFLKCYTLRRSWCLYLWDVPSINKEISIAMKYNRTAVCVFSVSTQSSWYVVIGQCQQ